MQYTTTYFVQYIHILDKATVSVNFRTVQVRLDVGESLTQGCIIKELHSAITRDIYHSISRLMQRIAFWAKKQNGFLVIVGTGLLSPTKHN